ncbi:hydrogenase expression/formation protein [Salmonella enterica subsp. enterica serovar 4,[5],12:i:-]|nr:hydrogenase expression/formation protein [Salmonella enterica subsp. enterica serovar 4,[5],12:i:-]EEI8827894.1 hydrogenase expression/formation protein [Salmonella enterica subsp. enterica serovar 4,[5],12:i:-]
MSNAFFHLLGPGTQPDDASFSMNPLPLTCQVNGDPSMAALERCAHSPAVMALLTDLRGQLARRIPEVGDVLGWELSPLNADDLSFLNTLLGEGEVSVRIQHPDGSESEIQETIFCGLWRVRHLHNRRLLTDRLEAGSAPLTLWQAATADTLPDDSLLPPPVAGLMNGLPLSEADRLFLARLCGHGNIQIRISGYGESQINATALRHLWHVRCLDALKGPLLDSYEICPLPELVLAAPEDLADSRQRLDEVCRWLETR